MYLVDGAYPDNIFGEFKFFYLKGISKWLVNIYNLQQSDRNKQKSKSDG